MIDVEDFIGRFPGKVKRTGPNKWMCQCPAHEDKSPSVSVTTGDDGRVLARCFAGCSFIDICESIGVELRDTLPDRAPRVWQPGDDKPVKFGSIKFSAIDALRCLAGEATVLAIAASDQAEGRVLSEAERNRLYDACGRITTALLYIQENQNGSA